MYVQGGDGNPFVAVQASSAELAEYKCFCDTMVTNRTLYSFRCKPPLFWQSVRAFFWTEGVVVQLSTPETAIDVDADGGRVMLLNVHHQIRLTSKTWSSCPGCW